MSLDTITEMEDVANEQRAESSPEDEFDESPIRRKCKECKQNEAIYQCPGCDVRTCSVECVKSHKRRTNCTGKRNRAAFLPLCRMTDSTLRSDYFLLEEVLDRMPRDQKRAKVDNLSKKARRLLQQCKRRDIKLEVMPSVMERHKKNNSWYSAPRNVITWKVEVILHPSLSNCIFQLSEDEENIMTHVKTKLNAPINGLHRLFMKQLPTSSKTPRYYEICKADSLRKFLPNKTIIEYPTIYCVPADSVAQFPTGTDKITEVPESASMEISNEKIATEAQI